MSEYKCVYRTAKTSSIIALLRNLTTTVIGLSEVLALHRNQLTGTITDNICQRLYHSSPRTKLNELSVDCDLIYCECCTCFVNGTLVK